MKVYDLSPSRLHGDAYLMFILDDQERQIRTKVSQLRLQWRDFLCKFLN